MVEGAAAAHELLIPIPLMGGMSPAAEQRWWNVMLSLEGFAVIHLTSL